MGSSFSLIHTTNANEHFGQKKKKKKCGNQRDSATERRRRVDTDLAVDVGSGVEQHLDHGLVAADAGVHERGHSLWEGGGGGSQRSGWIIHFYRALL